MRVSLTIFPKQKRHHNKAGQHLRPMRHRYSRGGRFVSVDWVTYVRTASREERNE